jgi:glycolate oxidase iron-sulfur subunit
MLDGGIEIDASSAEALNYCLLCKACVVNCPSKIKTDEAMIKAREYVRDKTGISFVHLLIGSVMKNNTLIAFASKVLKIAQKTGIAAVLPKGLIPIEFTRKQYQRMFAGPAGIPASVQCTESSALPEGKPKVAYFKGCAMKLLFPDVSADSVRVLSKVSTVDVVDNFCCGMMHKAHGMRKEALQLARTNMKLFENYDIVVTDCASCGSALKEYASLFSEDADWRDKAATFSSKVKGFSEYLYFVGYQPEYKASVNISYHDPCHLVRSQSVKSQPRAILEKAGNFIESAKADMCCGGGGTFHIDFPEVSGKILAEKDAAFRKTGADVIVTECPGCLVQLSKLCAEGAPYKVMHISQVI